MPIEYARALVEFAKRDALVALLIVRHRESPQLALYHVQQSIEKASKALLVLTGDPKYSATYLRRELSHNSLKASLEFIRVNAEIEDLKPLVRRSVKADVYDRLEEVIGESGTYAEELAWLSPSKVEGFLNITGQITPDKLLGDIIPDRALTLTVGQVDETDLVGSLLDVTIDYLNLRGHEKEKEIARPLAQKIIDVQGESNILAKLRSEKKIEIDIRGLIEELFIFARLVVGVYIMSALTFPHAALSRYPSEPGSSQRYDASVGAIILIRNLAKEADRISTDFLKYFDHIAGRIRAIHESYSTSG